MLSIRPAVVSDAALLRTLIRELAEYERELDSVAITEEQLAQDGFGPHPRFCALVAEWNSQPAGYALFFDVYSTWMGRQMFLEDLFVRPAFRGKGIGTAMMTAVAKIARQDGCAAMRWEVLAWNQPAVDLYTSMGAEFLDGWRMVMLRGDALEKLASSERSRC